MGAEDAVPVPDTPAAEPAEAAAGGIDPMMIAVLRGAVGLLLFEC
eukprot:SAG22_NODE_14814_length_364_cov_0.807547_1_plen_45_part_00